MHLAYLLPFLVASATVAIAAAATTTVINVTVDNVVLHLKLSDKALGERYMLDKRTPIVITCRAETAQATAGQRQLLLSPGSFDWRRTAGNESLLIKPGTRATAHNECPSEGLGCVSTLRIQDPVNSDAGVYECRVTPRYADGGAAAPTITAVGAFQSRPLITLRVAGDDKYDVAVDPSGSVTIACLVEGTPAGDIRWTKALDPSFNLTGNITLALSDLSYERDRGEITCVSRNDFGANEATMFLRVKSPRAFVPPLVGIGVELLVMLVIIVAYEVVTHRRRKLMLEGSDEHQTAGVDGKTD